MKRGPMKRDPIVADVRKTRDAFARRHGYDVDRIISAIQAEARAQAGAPTARRSVKKPSKRQRRAA